LWKEELLTMDEWTAEQHQRLKIALASTKFIHDTVSVKLLAREGALGVK
jgi:hypothetical protein